jgi:hypothetical protein
MRFKDFLVESAGLPDFGPFVRGFFANRLDTTTLAVYADRLEEAGNEKAAILLRTIAQNWRSPKNKKGQWQGQLISLLYDTFGHHPYSDRMKLYTDRSSYFIVPYKGGYYRSHYHYPLIDEGMTAYRFSLTNGAWSSYTNSHPHWVAVIPPGSRNRPYPAPLDISIRDFTPIQPQQIPEDVLEFAFFHLIEAQVRGGS